MDCSMPGFPVDHQLPGACSHSCPLSRWCHPTISSFIICFSSCLQSFPASGSFPMSLFFILGGQSIGVSASASVLLMNIPGWFPLGWTGWISLLSKGISRVLSNTTVQKHQFFCTQLSHPYMTTGKTIALTRQTLAKWYLCFLICYLGLLQLFFHAASVFKFCGCSHFLQWLWSPGE